jgi:hypothetical protein
MSYKLCKKCKAKISFSSGTLNFSKNGLGIRIPHQKMKQVCVGSAKVNLCQECFMKDKPEIFDCPLGDHPTCYQNKNGICIKNRED